LSEIILARFACTDLCFLQGGVYPWPARGDFLGQYTLARYFRLSTRWFFLRSTSWREERNWVEKVWNCTRTRDLYSGWCYATISGVWNRAFTTCYWCTPWYIGPCNI